MNSFCHSAKTWKKIILRKKMHFRAFLYHKCCKIRNNTPICILKTERTPNYDIVLDFLWFRCNKIMRMVFELQNLFFLCHQRFHNKNIFNEILFPNTKCVNNVHTKLNQSAFWNCALLIFAQQKMVLQKFLAFSLPLKGASFIKKLPPKKVQL